MFKPEHGLLLSQQDSHWNTLCTSEPGFNNLLQLLQFNTSSLFKNKKNKAFPNGDALSGKRAGKIKKGDSLINRVNMRKCLLPSAGWNISWIYRKSDIKLPAPHKYLSEFV